MKGTIAWKWVDNEGKEHKFRIPNSYYVPDGNVRLPCLQHWAQTQSKNHQAIGTGSETNNKEVTLYWNNKKNQLTVPLDRTDNVATFHLASGYDKFSIFCEDADIDYAQEQHDPLICEPAQVVSDDENDQEYD
jgi:hypothetical protein